MVLQALVGPGGTLAVGAAALVLALVHLAVSARRDLGAATLGALGAVAVALQQTPDPVAVALAGVTVVVFALASVRGASWGVGRPGLTGSGVAVAGLAAVVRAGLPWLAPGAEPAATGALVGACLVFTALALPLALERPGPRRARPRWSRRIVVESVPDPTDAPSASGPTGGAG